MVMVKKNSLIDRRNFILIFTVALVAVVVGFWVPYQRSRNAPQPSQVTGKATVHVAYKSTGFEPKSVTVPIGTTVSWSNGSGRAMWVASDPHPAHTDLKGFDELRPVNQITPSLFIGTAYAHEQEIYKYTFAKKGIWKYHNHISPQDRGVIIVN